VNLHRRLVAVMAILLVVGLGVADFVTYASVSSFLYGRADDQLSSSEILAANYLIFAADHKVPPTAAELSHRVSPDLYLLVLDTHGHVIVSRPSGSPWGCWRSGWCAVVFAHWPTWPRRPTPSPRVT
jgi:hypothetical protein